MPERSPSSLTDQELVALALQERERFGELIERYHQKLGRYIGRLGVKNLDDQDDVLQEIFIKVYRNLNSFDQSLSFSAWIYRIAHNEAIGWYRKQKARPEGYLVSDPETILELTAAPGESAEKAFDMKLDAALVGQALERLDEKYRSVLILRFFEHLEYEEISDVLKVPTGTVGTLVHRAKKHLRQELEAFNKNL